jgi:hypothetical protein
LFFNVAYYLITFGFAASNILEKELTGFHVNKAAPSPKYQPGDTTKYGTQLKVGIALYKPLSIKKFNPKTGQSLQFQKTKKA